MDVSLQTKQYLADVRLNLQKMVRTLHVTDASLQTLAVISDTSWAWGAIQPYTPILHERIRKDPFAVAKLRCLFLKLKSVLELPLLRISQIGSPDIYSVGEFYSQELVGYVRSVVEVIPVSMFAILTRIIAVQTDRLKELPTRLEKTAFKDYAQARCRCARPRASVALPDTPSSRTLPAPPPRPARVTPPPRISSPPFAAGGALPAGRGDALRGGADSGESTGVAPRRPYLRVAEPTRRARPGAPIRRTWRTGHPGNGENLHGRHRG